MMCAHDFGLAVRLATTLLSLPTIAGSLPAQQWTPPQNGTITLPERGDAPIVACTADELERLREAYRGSGPEHEVAKRAVQRGDEALAKEIVFPPRGGQHNQWYQCEACQMGLETQDATHHRCPSCKKVYSGEPYDDVVYSRVHSANCGAARDAAWAFAITGEAKYSERAAEVLLGYADRYQRYPYHDNRRTKKSRTGGHLKEQTLSEASLLVDSIAPAYDLIRASLDEAQREHIESDLLLPMLRNLDKHKAGKSNWQTWHNAAMVWGGAVIGDVTWVQKALTARKHGFLSQMEESVTSDGMWYENSWGYHFYTLRALTEIAEACRRLGIDVWGHPKLLAMYTLPAHYTMADGSLPRFGDDVNSSASKVTGLLEPAYAASHDEAILALLPKQPSFESVLLGRDAGADAKAPALRSCVFEGAGHAILRNREGMSAAFTFGPFGGFHGHFDKLSFVLFAHDKELGVDPGRARSQAYRLPIHTDWYRATLAHNTVVVDRRSQEGTAGELRLFAAGLEATAVAALVDDAYSGVDHERLLVLMPDYLLVVDDLRSRRAHQYDWVFHAKANQAHSAVAKRRHDWGNDYPGTEYIRSARRGETDEPVAVRFQDRKVEIHVHAAAAASTAVTIGDGPIESVHQRSPLMMLSREHRRTAFAVAIEPVAAGSKPAITAVELDQSNKLWTVRVTREGGVDTVEYEPGERVLVGRDGRALCEK